MNFIKRFTTLNPLYFLSITILFCILRMVVPLANYIFIPFLVLFIFFTISNFSKIDLLQFIGKYIRLNYQVLVISLFVFFSIFSSSSISLFSLKELIYVILILFLSFSLFLYVDKSNCLYELSSIFCNQVILFSTTIGLIGIIKFILQIIGFEYISIKIIGTSLVKDYNFYILFSFIGLVSLYFKKANFSKVNFTVIFIILNINIIFSGSRRGLILLIIFWFLLFVYGLNLKFEIKQFRKRIYYLTAIITFFFIIFISFKNFPQMITSNESFDLSLTSKNPFRQTFTSIVSRYLTILNYSNTYYDLYSKLWLRNGTNYKKRDYERLVNNLVEKNLIYNGTFENGLLFWQPYGNATKHSIIKSPYGNAVRVVRFNGDGGGWPLLYKGRDIIFYSNHTYQLEFIYKVIKGKEIPFKVGFEVSEPNIGPDDSRNLKINLVNLPYGWKQGICKYTFNSSYSKIRLFMNSQNDSSIVEFADIKLIDKDINSELPIFSDQVSNTDLEVMEYLKNYDLKNFAEPAPKNLISNGDFILRNVFWVPGADSTFHSIVETPYGSGIKVSRLNGNGGDWSLRYVGRPIIYHAGHKYVLSFLYKVIEGNDMPFNIGWWVNDGGQGFIETVSLPLKIINYEYGWKKAVCSYRFKETHYDLGAFLNSLQDYSTVIIAKVALYDSDGNDSLPDFVDQLKVDSEKIEYIDSINQTKSNNQLKNDLYVFDNKLFMERTNRWKYSWIVFDDSLSINQKLFGGGFDYLEMFGAKFGEGKYDYPHNPFLSAFLYSGIIGGIAYIWFMFLVFYYYIKYYRYHIYFFICFLVAFYFSFFSANTHFSVPIYAILCIIPFLTKYIVENEKKNAEQPHS